MKKRGLSIVLIFSLIVLSTSILAEQTFDVNKGFNWMVSNSDKGSYGNSIVTTAFAAAALKNSGEVTLATSALDWIKSQEDDNHCWPKGNCKTKDTAFALWILNEFGEKTEDGEAWLKNALTPALKNNWWLQVITSENGTCKISYPVNNEIKEDTIRVDAGEFPDCTVSPTRTFFDINKCLKTKNILVSNPSTTLDVNCASLGPSTIISIVYNKGNTFTLIDQATTERYLVTVNNGCFGDSSKGSCSKDNSLYINWILSEIESKTNVDAWLKEKYDNLQPFDNSLMYLSSEDNSQTFLDDLIKLQRNDGSFEKEIFDTSIAILALKESGSTDQLNKAVDFLKSRQREDGSWEGNLLKTTVALYSAFSDANVIVTPPSGRTICGDNVCEPPETSSTCPEDCDKPSTVCDENGECDAEYGENSQNCPSDCICGDNVCDSVEKSMGTCKEDCIEEPKDYCGDDIAEGFEECDGTDDSFCPGLCQPDCTCGEKKGGFTWLIILIILLILGVAGYFIYVKFFKTEKKKPTKRPDFRPFTSRLESSKPSQTVRYSPSQRKEKPSKVEDELEKSLKAAKKLIKKI